MPTKAAITLVPSEVVFDAVAHRYDLGGRRLSGITALIRDVVGLGYHGEAPQFFLDRAAEYGSAVHRAIEMFDTLGLEDVLHPKSERFADDEAVWDVSRELANYRLHREGYTPLANEYTVSDGLRYASQIDNVWLDAEGCIVLADTKTNNIASYPGGRSHWLKYLSWQLSAYAVLFERQNPGLRVSRLVCNWLRHNDHELIDVERLPDEDVERLLSVTWSETADGTIVFDELSANLNGFAPRSEAVVKANVTLPLASEVIFAIAECARQEAEAKARGEELRAKLRAAMEAAHVTKWANDLFTATLSADAVVRALDAKRLQAEHPELCSAYMRESTRKGAFKITLNDSK